MVKKKTNRRIFLKNTALATAAITLGGNNIFASDYNASKNILPRWKKTPHDIFLAWFGDVIDILTKNGIGYALWNFRGDFGILDSGRTDISYTDWYGHKLDSKLLDLLKKY